MASCVETSHNDVIIWKHFPRYWFFVRGNHRSPVDSPHKASDAELWSVLWSAPEQTVEQTIGTSVIWCTIVLIVTSPVMTRRSLEIKTNIQVYSSVPDSNCITLFFCYCTPDLTKSLMCTCGYLSMPGLKLNRVRSRTGIYTAQPLILVAPNHKT